LQNEFEGLQRDGAQRQVLTTPSAASARRAWPLELFAQATATLPLSSSSTRSTTVHSSPKRRDWAGYGGAERSGQVTASSGDSATDPTGEGNGGTPPPGRAPAPAAGRGSTALSEDATTGVSATICGGWGF
jgi:hypothetical protein